jgi:hypothetical protein
MLPWAFFPSRGVIRFDEQAAEPVRLKHSTCGLSGYTRDSCSDVDVLLMSMRLRADEILPFGLATRLYLLSVRSVPARKEEILMRSGIMLLEVCGSRRTYVGYIVRLTL